MSICVYACIYVLIGAFWDIVLRICMCVVFLCIVCIYIGMCVVFVYMDMC